MAPLAIAWLAAGAIVGCGAEDAAEAPADEPAAEAPAEAEAAPTGEVVIEMDQVPWAVNLDVNLGRMVRQRSGLYVQVLAEGSGPRAEPGDTMAVHYRVWLPNGRQVDASYDHQPPEPLEMVLGETSLIAGWVQGVTGMRAGERRRLVIPHDLAYGPAGHPAGIPPFSPLLYELELVRLAEGVPPDPASSPST